MFSAISLHFAFPSIGYSSGQIASVTSSDNNNLNKICVDFIKQLPLGAVHNCQHLCIRTERTEEGGGHEASVLIFKC